MARLMDKVLRAGEGKILRRLEAVADLVEEIEDDYVQMSDAELRAQTDEFRAAPGRRRDAGRPDAGGVRGGPRGRQAHPGPAALQGADDGRRRAAPGQHRRDAHRRGQDPGRHAAGVPERAGRQGRAHRHHQRLPGRARLLLDGPGAPLPGPAGRRDPGEHDAGRAPRAVRLRHHLRHQQRVRLRLPARQHGVVEGGDGAARALLRLRRRGRLDPHRRGPDPADHLRPGGPGHQVVHRLLQDRGPAGARTSTTRSTRRSAPSASWSAAWSGSRTCSASTTSTSP